MKPEQVATIGSVGGPTVCLSVLGLSDTVPPEGLIEDLRVYIEGCVIGLSFQFGLSSPVSRVSVVM